MSFFPILDAPNVTGKTTIYNFPPNNWEYKNVIDRYVNITWNHDGRWFTKNIDFLPKGGAKTYTRDQFLNDLPEQSMILLSLTKNPENEESLLLPKFNSVTTTIPAYRATIGFKTKNSETSYQGELESFPEQGTLLTFGPFIQFGQLIKNFLLFLNLESSAFTRSAELELFSANDFSKKGKFIVRSNTINIVPLDQMIFGEKDLPVFICRNMAGIPLYFSKTIDGEWLSLEHTHPPASLVVHGDRWGIQKFLKQYWFLKLPK